MKNLFLVRHAKSGWDTFTHDFERSITDRGRTDAELVSKAIAEILPDHFVIRSSTARRAVETALIFARNISYPIDRIDFRNELYTFSESDLEKVVWSTDNSYENVILFGHNDAITNFVNKFGNAFIDNVATSGFIWLRFDSDTWSSITKGETRKIVFPRDLKS